MISPDMGFVPEEEIVEAFIIVLFEIVITPTRPEQSSHVIIVIENNLLIPKALVLELIFELFCHLTRGKLDLVLAFIKYHP
jgi:hypothetical protein